MRIFSKRKMVPWWKDTQSFVLNKRKYSFFCHSFNCGWPPFRMTERAVELAIADDWLFKHDDVCEVGAVTPYYWPGRVKDVVDPSDENSAINIRLSLFDMSFENRNVLCISTIEHVGQGDYGLDKEPGLASKALEKITAEASSALITIPVGYNVELDRYVFARKGNDVTISYLGRGNGREDNDWRQISMPSGHQLTYGPKSANAVIVIEK